MNKYEKLSETRDNLVGYMKLKIEVADWHAVADAAMDLREVEVALEYEKDMQAQQDIKKGSTGY